MIITRLCQFFTHLFFSRVSLTGVQRVPADGPTLIVANHHSALVDPMVLIAVLPRRARFLAKAVLWKPTYLPLRPLLMLAGAVPVHRVKDGGGDNSATFEATRSVLTDGGVIAVFGEGVSHDTPGLQVLRTGPARIALGLPTAVSIVPIGLIFPDRPRYRSTVTVAIGEPIAVTGSVGGDDDRVAVRDLTTRIRHGLATVAPTWDDHDDQRAAAAAARAAAAERDIAEGTVLNRINRASDAGVAQAREVLNTAKDLLDECAHLDVDLQQVLDDHGRLGALARSSQLRAVLWAVPTILGHIMNWPAYRSVDAIARRNDFNFQASAKVLAGAVLYPLWWAVMFVACWRLVSWPAAALLVLAAMVGGYVAGEKMRLIKSYNARMAAEENSTDLTSLELRFAAVLSAVDRLGV